ncbi:energy transducer TonB [Caldichromatium japonicum]|uniref:Protein TonB n=1 Tax=Caldichromatium japonicum TaxID=2699430 RepID=A0A6G7VGF1_9GAMM|nr:energy transducer TonB [Caldichromatium japonicum]QIK38956.1 energy transducer TonB [Caldichromatium japonicum]
MTPGPPPPGVVQRGAARAMGGLSPAHSGRVPPDRTPHGLTLALLISAALHGFAAFLPPRAGTIQGRPQGAPLALELVSQHPTAVESTAARAGSTSLIEPAEPPSTSAAPLHSQDTRTPQIPSSQSQHEMAQPKPRPLAPPAHQTRHPPAHLRGPRVERRPPTRLHQANAGAMDRANPQQASQSGDSPVSAFASGTAPISRRAADERTYLQALAAAIARQQSYPEEARRLGHTGTVTLGLTIQGDGRLTGIQLIQGSGHRALDQAALNAVQQLGRFQPIPPLLHRSTWAIQIPIRFQLD